MKKYYISIIIAITIIFSLNIISFAALSNKTYTDNESGATFNIPLGWSQKEFNEQREVLDVKFVCNSDNTKMILFSCADFWNEFNIIQKIIYTRVSTNADMLSKEFCLNMLDSPLSSDVTISEFNGYKYYITNTVINKNSITLNMTYFITVVDGYLYMFQFSGTSNDRLYSDFIDLINSASLGTKYAVSSSESIYKNNTIISIIDLLLSIIVTVTIYSLPIIIYRYVIKKSPLPPSKSKIIVIVYGIIAYIVMFFVKFFLGGGKMSSGAIILWSFINYKILSSKYNKKDNEEQHINVSNISSIIKIKIFDEQKGIYEKTENENKLPPTYKQYLDENGILYAVIEHLDGKDKINLVYKNDWRNIVQQYNLKKNKKI